MVAERHISLALLLLFSGLLLTKSTLIWAFGMEKTCDRGRGSLRGKVVRGNETKHEQHLFLYLLTVVCIVLFPAL